MPRKAKEKRTSDDTPAISQVPMAEEERSGETPEEVREAYRAEDEEEPKKRKKRGRRPKSEPEEPALTVTPEQVEKLVTYPFDFTFTRLSLPPLTERERADLSLAAAPLLNKYAGFLSAYVPEIFFCMVVISIVEPRYRIAQERREAEEREEKARPFRHVQSGPATGTTSYPPGGDAESR